MKTHINSHIIFILSLFVFSSCSVNSEKISRRDFRKQPTDLKSAIRQLNGFYPDSTKRTVAQLDEYDFATNRHEDFGLILPDKWRLREINVSTFKLDSLTDRDIETIILTTFHRDLNNRKWDTESLVDFYVVMRRSIHKHSKRFLGIKDTTDINSGIDSIK
jgi:hypothetical protein